MTSRQGERERDRRERVDERQAPRIPELLAGEHVRVVLEPDELRRPKDVVPGERERDEPTTGRNEKNAKPTTKGSR